MDASHARGQCPTDESPFVVVPQTVQGRRFVDVEAGRRGDHREVVALYTFDDVVRGPRVRCRVVGTGRTVTISQVRLLSPALYAPAGEAA